jgi:pimeloyl-ACP methyl ester carboxylesterase
MQIHQRIQRALAAVREARGGVLQQNDVVLFGYSQGASRAEALVARYPEQYRWVVLGGPPLRPTVAALQHAASVVVFGGERENTAQMSRGARDLSAAGVRSRYFEIPGATHGQFGASGNAVIGDALRWLLAAEGPGAPTSSGPRGGASEL